MCIRNITTELRRRRHASGVTLVEFLIAFSVGMIVLTALLSFTVFTSRGFAGAFNYVEMEAQSRSALDRMSREIRQVNLLTAYSTGQVAFLDHDNKTLTYSYSPETHTLTRMKDGQSDVLLTGCESLDFSIFKRNTTNGTYDQYPTTVEASNCKVVQVSWVCSREVTGTKLNTETVQTAKIVIRNQ